MIQRLQTLFNLLVGVHQGEAMLRTRARQVFAPSFDCLAEIERPAYLRRKSRIRVVATRYSEASTGFRRNPDHHRETV